MIPKRLFFIWFGDTEAKYVKVSTNIFKEINPDYEFNFLRYNISRIDNLKPENFEDKYDKDVYKCIRDILEFNKDSFYFKPLKYYISQNRRFTQILSNILRLELLNNYGGIYLDCDTFPNKPFDDELLNRKSFTVKHYYKYSGGDVCAKNCFFIGSDSTEKYSSFWDYKDELQIYGIKWWDDYEWQLRQVKFKHCKLEYTYNKNNFYIDHYNHYSWNPGNCKTPLCKYDEFLPELRKYISEELIK